jgi:hypothetical protein
METEGADFLGLGDLVVEELHDVFLPPVGVVDAVGSERGGQENSLRSSFVVHEIMAFSMDLGDFPRNRLLFPKPW